LLLADGNWPKEPMWLPTWKNPFPNLEQFARDHLDDVDVIGFGTQDSRDEPLGFVEQYGTSSFTMLWDESFQSWSAFEITGKPTVILLGTTGEELGRSSGAIPEAEVLELGATANNWRGPLHLPHCADVQARRNVQVE
jgi:hypothetical protein